jgi:hypothetical protein
MASAREAAARRTAEELLAAAAAEPLCAEAAGGESSSPESPPAVPRPRVFTALEALQRFLRDGGPASAEAALGVEGLVPALLREGAGPADPGGSLDSVTCSVSCLIALATAADRAHEAGHVAQRVAAALSATLQRDPAGLFDAMGRAAKAQAAARGAGVAGQAGSAGAPLAPTSLAAVTPGLQLFLMLHLARAHLLSGSGPGAGAPALAFARSGDAVAAALEAPLHGCPDCGLGDARTEAASVLMLLCSDAQAVPHLRGSFPRIVPVLIRRLEPGAPSTTPAEQSHVLRTLQVRQPDLGRVL